MEPEIILEIKLKGTYEELKYIIKEIMYVPETILICNVCPRNNINL